jgi:hypothetical protein
MRTRDGPSYLPLWPTSCSGSVPMYRESYLRDRDVADYHDARRADGLWFYFGLFDRTGRNKNINSSLPYPSLFSLCPLCSLVARSKTGGEYKLVADQWTSSNSSLPLWAIYSFNSKGTSIFVLNLSSGVGTLSGNIFAISSILRCIVSREI